MVTAFHAPRSYTGEDVVEIATHGSPVVLDTVVRAVLEAGRRGEFAVRLADPGEFTQRAFASGRLDLTQAEAVHDLIAARTVDQVRQAAGQLGGALSRRLAGPKDRLLHLIALLEAGMDFASGELDDVDVVPPAYIAEEIALSLGELGKLAASFAHGSLLRQGASLAFVGRPNAGKSSLFNCLLERERAIVTPIAGTTRDTVEESWAIHGVPLRLVDTAGLRDLSEDGAPADAVEALGIARSREALADADLVLLVHDASLPWTASELALAKELEHRPHLIVSNKSDVAMQDAAGPRDAVATSAVTGAGIVELRERILRELGAGTAPGDAAVLTTQRQFDAVQRALDALRQAAEANHAALPHEVLLVDLHHARAAVDSLTGQTTPDDILARIFSAFCIGK